MKFLVGSFTIGSVSGSSSSCIIKLIEMMYIELNTYGNKYN